MCHADAPSTPSPRVVTEEVAIGLHGGEALPALFAHPPTASEAGGGLRPAVLIVHDIYGRTPFYEDLAARLADAGYHALLPDAFFRQGALEQTSPPSPAAPSARASTSSTSSMRAWATASWRGR